MTRQIREVRGEERADTAWPLTRYAFSASPTPAASLAEWQERAKEQSDSRTLVAFVDGRPLATAQGLTMRQNVRGRVVDALGVASVAAHPDARRGGHVRALLGEMHRLALEAGQVVTALYPFRPSFYAQFGYTGLTRSRDVRMFPAGMEELRKLDLDATVTLHETTEADAWAAYLSVEDRWLAKRHGMMLEVDAATRAKDGTDGPMMLALVRRGGEVIGGMPFTTVEFGGELRARRFLVDDPIGRLALLRWLGSHADQFGNYAISMPPGDYPETWYTDVAVTDETVSKVPTHGAPMARVLDLPGLAGISVGSGEVVVEVTGENEPGVARRWSLSGEGGRLAVASSTAAPQATLSIGGLSSLIYGTQNTAVIAARAQGTFEPAGAAALNSMFDRQIPYVHKAF